MNTRTLNGIGYEIQEHAMPAGWVAVSKAYKTMSAARAEMLRMPDAPVERRVYERLAAA
jgi:hypothetical protein